jgi:DMSO/TMAO reductase YedYZ molybdopterin-dependent catalytic subunit/thiosulfate reductase cytochrome b subunit
MGDFDYPAWVRLSHAFNILFLSLLIRSGIEILGGHPMLYWNDACRPGSEWIRFTRKTMPTDRLWTAEDEKEPYSPWIALPGHDHLGIGRYWHFTAALGWVLTGVFYVLMLFFTSQWDRLIPRSWDVFPGALDAARTYLHFRIPETDTLFNPLQQLAYFGVIFILAPLQILTGIAMSPAIAGRFPWYTRLFGGRQAARSIHFIGMIGFVAFTTHHTAIVVAHGLGHELAMILLGKMDATPAQQRLAIALGIAGLVALVAFHVWATRASLREPRRIQYLLMGVVDPARRLIFGRLESQQHYPRAAITTAPRPNGRPPRNETYTALLDTGFAGWRLDVGGLVENPAAYTLDELRAMPRQTQITRHNCIQGWSYIAEWEGVRVEELLRRCQPLPAARYLLFETFDEKWEDAGHGLGNFYSVITLEQARHHQTLLAWGMNGACLPAEFGAPLRLRLEEQLGFKMAKYVSRITLIEDYHDIGAGQGNWRADHLYYSEFAPI